MKVKPILSWRLDNITYSIFDINNRFAKLRNRLETLLWNMTISFLSAFVVKKILTLLCSMYRYWKIKWSFVANATVCLEAASWKLAGGRCPISKTSATNWSNFTMKRQKWLSDVIVKHVAGWSPWNLSKYTSDFYCFCSCQTVFNFYFLSPGLLYNCKDWWKKENG